MEVGWEEVVYRKRMVAVAVDECKPQAIHGSAMKRMEKHKVAEYASLQFNHCFLCRTRKFSFFQHCDCTNAKTYSTFAEAFQMGIIARL